MELGKEEKGKYKDVSTHHAMLCAVQLDVANVAVVLRFNINCQIPSTVCKFNINLHYWDLFFIFSFNYKLKGSAWENYYLMTDC